MPFSTAASGADPDAPDIRRAFDAAWEDPAFVRREPGWLAQRLTELRDRIFEFIQGLVPELDLSEGWAAALGQFMLWLLGIAVVLALVWAVHSLLSRKRKGEGLPGAARSRPESDSTDPAEWARRAGAAAAEGDWRRAALFRYRSVVFRLVAAGHLRPREGRTAGDHARELARRAPGLAPDFRALVRVLHPVAFGPRDPGADDYRRLEEQAAVLDRHADQGASAPAGTATPAERPSAPEPSHG